MSEQELIKQNALLEEHIFELREQMVWTEKLFAILWAHCDEGGTPQQLREMSANGVTVMGWVVEAAERCLKAHYPDVVDES